MVLRLSHKPAISAGNESEFRKLYAAYEQLNEQIRLRMASAAQKIDLFKWTTHRQETARQAGDEKQQHQAPGTETNQKILKIGENAPTHGIVPPASVISGSFK